MTELIEYQPWVRDDLRLFAPLDGVTPLNSKTFICH
jgi:hypothetical protein